MGISDNRIFSTTFGFVKCNSWFSLIWVSQQSPNLVLLVSAWCQQFGLWDLRIPNSQIWKDFNWQLLLSQFNYIQRYFSLHILLLAKVFYWGDLTTYHGILLSKFDYLSGYFTEYIWTPPRVFNLIHLTPYQGILLSKFDYLPQSF